MREKIFTPEQLANLKKDAEREDLKEKIRSGEITPILEARREDFNNPGDAVKKVERARISGNVTRPRPGRENGFGVKRRNFEKYKQQRPDIYA